jgi:hypothetical protein
MSQVTLVANQHDDYIVISMISQLSQPTFNILVSQMFGYVINKQCSNCSPIVPAKSTTDTFHSISYVVQRRLQMFNSRPHSDNGLAQHSLANATHCYVFAAPFKISGNKFEKDNKNKAHPQLEEHRNRKKSIYAIHHHNGISVKFLYPYSYQCASY